MSIPSDGKILPSYSPVNNAHIGKSNGKEIVKQKQTL